MDLKVPAGSQPGDQLLLRGRGIKKLNSSMHGNQFVHLNVVIPKYVVLTWQLGYRCSLWSQLPHQLTFVVVVVVVVASGASAGS